VAGGWIRFYSEELRNLYASPNIIKVLKCRTMRWARHVARTGEITIYKILFGKPEGKNHSEDLGVDGNTIRMDLTERVGRCGLDSSASGQGSVAGSCEHDNEPSGSIKGGEILDWLLKKDSVLRCESVSQLVI
jgi:hypothetical protein